MTSSETKIRTYPSLTDSLAKMGGGAGLALFGIEWTKAGLVLEIVFILAAILVEGSAIAEYMFGIHRRITDGKGGGKNDKNKKRTNRA